MNLPEPLVPSECTMSGNDWFPLHFDRLRKSKWWRRATDLARARNVMMWGEAYKQVPAGSLPDDDDELAEAAGFGMDIDSFTAAKDEIMSPWVMCSDGRWYHPTVCEVVLEAWERTSERRKNAAAKKAAQRAKTRGHSTPGASVPAKSEGVPGDNADVPRDTDEKGGDIATHDITGQDRTDSPPLPPQGRGDGSLFGDEPAAARRKPKRSIPVGYPDDAAIADEQAKAREAGANIDVRYQAERFRNWAIGKDAKYADWPATWRNWMARNIHEAPKTGAPTAAAPAPKAADMWARRIHAYRQNAYWNRLDWGPPPGKPGCTIPDEVLMTAGYVPIPAAKAEVAA